MEMESPNSYQHLENWKLIGTNFTKADVDMRSRFAVTHSQMVDVYAKAMDKGLKDFFVLSTCNRTEFYGCAPMSLMQELVSDQLGVSDSELNEYFYFESGKGAVRHFFNVVSGLNSQIIGDYEIAGQVRKAIQLSRQYGLTGTLTDRISSFAFHASKVVKTQTHLSSGKYSLSYATAELINRRTADQPVNRILIIGTGEMGRAVSRNLREYFPGHELTVTNRTLANATGLAEEISGKILPFETFTNHLHEFDAIIATAEAENFLINAGDVPEGRRIFLDLSVPQVIDPEIKSISGVSHYSLDEISMVHNDLVKQRLQELPKAERIIEQFIDKLIEWQSIFMYTAIALSYKEKVKRIIGQSGTTGSDVERVFSGLIQQIRFEGYKGCSVIQTVNDLIAPEG